jgi:hypothetical protein
MFPAGNRRDGSRWARGGAGPGTGTRAGGREGTRAGEGGGCDPGMDTLGPRRAGTKWQGEGRLRPARLPR